MLSLFPLTSDVLKLIPAVDPRNREKFTAAQIRSLAVDINLYEKAEDLDMVHSEWLQFQLDDIPADISSPDKFWDTVTSDYLPHVTPLMRAILCIPHSNASSERVFSMLKKIHTDMRNELSQDSINSLLSTKINYPSCCHEAELSNSLLTQLKQSTKTYNMRHLRSECNASSSAVTPTSTTVVIDDPESD